MVSLSYLAHVKNEVTVFLWFQLSVDDFPVISLKPKTNLIDLKYNFNLICSLEMCLQTKDTYIRTFTKHFVKYSFSSSLKIFHSRLSSLDLDVANLSMSCMDLEFSCREEKTDSSPEIQFSIICSFPTLN